MIKLLVSIRHPSEFESAVRGGADIVDVKEPSRGSLGLPDYSVLREVIERSRKLNTFKIEVSCASGDVKKFEPYLEYIAHTAGSLGVNYFKVGIAMKSLDEAKIVGLRLSDVLKSFNTKLVLVGYADYERAESLEPLKVIDIAKSVGASVVMIDTYVKDGKTTFNLLTRSYLEKFVKETHENGLMAAIAGSLRKHHVFDAVKLEFDIIGFRGAVCTGGREGIVSEELVRELKRTIIAAFKTIES
ncbi:MAG: (5-formylfuran-3-yl)methyl phosphate synthase [Desulfurococcaceae archaeon]|jgi:uncharacterized protein (UPF0264 family)|nr:(5-formylfuran-3-yl)methyl phosphate synthase [Desulfurococcaceae archaeon]